MFRNTFLTLVFVFLFIQCTDDPLIDNTGSLRIDNINLPEIDGNYEYRVWLLVENTPVYVEDFNISEVENGAILDITDFNSFDLEDATAAAITVNATSEANSAGDYILLAGNFDGSTANLESDFQTADGRSTLQHEASLQYTIQTPTTSATTADDNNGVWFFSSNSVDSTSLVSNFKFDGNISYQSFLSFNQGDSISLNLNMGAFSDSLTVDNSNVFTTAASASIPAFAGEDFLRNRTGISDLTDAFPLDVRGDTLKVVALPPSYTGTQEPFGVTLWQGVIAENATSGAEVIYDLEKVNTYSARVTKL